MGCQSVTPLLPVPRSLWHRNPTAAAPHPVQRGSDPWHLRLRSLHERINARLLAGENTDTRIVGARVCHASSS